MVDTVAVTVATTGEATVAAEAEVAAGAETASPNPTRRLATTHR